MSHELRTPLNGIIGLTEMVLETNLTSSQREYLNLVRASGESLLGLINDVLDMSKLDAGRLELEIEPFELRDRLTETLKTLAVGAHRKGVELACRVGPKVPDCLLGDLARLRQIVVNLVGNAIKFTERGEIVVEVACPQRTATAVTLQVTIRDTGIGIPKENLAQLFQPYAQADASIARRFGGTGLGLSISARLVEAMQGRIWVDSEVGVGSAFHFAVELQHDTAREKPAALAGQSALAGQRVLLAEPQPTTARMLKEMLGDWGLAVVAVASGEEAARAVEDALAQGYPFSFLLMDVRVPNCLAWLQKIRGERTLAAVMLLTADQVNEGARCDELRIPHLLMDGSDQLKVTPLSELATIVQPGASRVIAPSSTVGARILLAEDGLVNQKVALALLAKKGHQVTLVTNGNEALAALERQSFDLVLMDVLMPKMGGLEATQAIRAGEQMTERHLPIIAMTAGNSPPDIQRCLTAGMDAFLSKPVRQEQLFATLDEFLAGGRAAGGSTAIIGAVDWPAALRQVGGRHELLAERVSLLQQEIPRVQQDLVTAAAQKDGTSLRIAAHTLKVALGAFGAPRLAHLAQQLEETSRHADQPGASELLTAFQQESQRLVEALAQFSRATAL
jgi:two-component system sensor histidine kinase/response regulator